MIQHKSPHATPKKFFTAHELKDRLNEHVQRFCAEESRIRLYPLYGDLDADKGFFITKEHIFIPFELPKAEHDICHLIELRNSKRWTLPDWGMPRFEEETLEPGPFFAALAREVRTRAIQLHVSTFYNEADMIQSNVYKQLNNSYWAEMAEKLIPFGRFQTMQDVHVWADDLRERTFKAWSVERIQYEWRIRLDYIRNWMETSASHSPHSNPQPQLSR